jgi:hypothetical protein
VPDGESELGSCTEAGEECCNGCFARMLTCTHGLLRQLHALDLRAGQPIVVLRGNQLQRLDGGSLPLFRQSSDFLDDELELLGDHA